MLLKLGPFLGLPLVWYGVTTLMLRHFNRTENANPALLWPAQFTALAALSAIITGAVVPGEGGVLVLITVLIFPPIILAALVLTPFLATTALPVGVVVFALAALSRETRGWALAFATLAMALSIPLTANIYWDRQMCARANALGLENVQRAPFMYNLRRASRKSGREPYAIAYLNGEVWDWGYTRANFTQYRGEIPGWADMSKFTPLTCATSPR